MKDGEGIKKGKKYGKWLKVRLYNVKIPRDESKHTHIFSHQYMASKHANTISKKHSKKIVREDL